MIRRNILQAAGALSGSLLLGLQTTKAASREEETTQQLTKTSKTPITADGTRRMGQQNVYNMGPSPDIGEWHKDDANPVLAPTQKWENGETQDAGLIKDFTLSKPYVAVYAGDGPDASLGVAFSDDLSTWVKPSWNPILTPGSGWESKHLASPALVKLGDTYHLFYTASSENKNNHNAFGLATSTDLKNWTRHPENPILKPGKGDVFDTKNITNPHVIRIGFRWHLFYAGMDKHYDWRIGKAISVDNDPTTFAKVGENPIIEPGDGDAWDNDWVYDPTVFWTGGAGSTASPCAYMLYPAKDTDDVRRIGVAVSANEEMTQWVKHPENPILADSQAWEDEGIAGPTLIRDDDGTFEMLYQDDYAGNAIGHARFDIF